MKDYPIDIVIPWVDGSDPAWRAQKSLYNGESTASVHSFDYQDWGLLKYWFRGIEKNAPWINTIHFVTWGHLPTWLNTEHPKLHIVRHEDYLPSEYTPTFNANTIELNFHRIKDLSEHFIYFNDDMYLVKPTTKEDFFHKGQPCDSAIINPIAPANNNCIAHMQLTNAAVINQHFLKHNVIRSNFFKWFNYRYGKLILLNLLFVPWSRFPGLLETHLPTSFLKNTYYSVWKEEYELLDNTSKHRFRNFKIDVNQWLLKEWQIASGSFYPRRVNAGKLIPVRDISSAQKAVKMLLKGKYYMVCVNDHVENPNNLKEIIQIVQSGFESLFPQKSRFEV